MIRLDDPDIELQKGNLRVNFMLIGKTHSKKKTMSKQAFEAWFHSFRGNLIVWILCDLVNLARSCDDMDFIFAAHPALRSLVQSPENSQRQMDFSSCDNLENVKARKSLKRRLVVSEKESSDEESVEEPTCTKSTQPESKITLIG